MRAVSLLACGAMVLSILDATVANTAVAGLRQDFPRDPFGRLSRGVTSVLRRADPARSVRRPVQGTSGPEAG